MVYQLSLRKRGREGGGKNMHTKALVNKNNATAIFVRAVRVTACVIHIKMYIQTTMWPRFTRYITRMKCSSTRTASYSGTLDTNGTEEGVLNNEVSSMKLLFLERGNIFTEMCLCVSCDKPHLPDAP